MADPGVSSLSLGTFKQRPAIVGGETHSGVINVSPELDPHIVNRAWGMEVHPPVQDRESHMARKSFEPKASISLRAAAEGANKQFRGSSFSIKRICCFLTS